MSALQNEFKLGQLFSETQSLFKTRKKEKSTSSVPQSPCSPPTSLSSFLYPPFLSICNPYRFISPFLKCVHVRASVVWMCANVHAYMWRPKVSSRYLLNHSSPHFLSQSVIESGTSWLARLAGHMPRGSSALWLPSVEPTGLQLHWLSVRVLRSKTLVFFTLMQSSTD